VNRSDCSGAAPRCSSRPCLRRAWRVRNPNTLPPSPWHRRLMRSRWSRPRRTQPGNGQKRRRRSRHCRSAARQRALRTLLRNQSAGKTLRSASPRRYVIIRRKRYRSNVPPGYGGGPRNRRPTPRSASLPLEREGRPCRPTLSAPSTRVGQPLARPNRLSDRRLVSVRRAQPWCPRPSGRPSAKRLAAEMARAGARSTNGVGCPPGRRSRPRSRRCLDTRSRDSGPRPRSASNRRRQRRRSTSPSAGSRSARCRLSPYPQRDNPGRRVPA
jgi:hypothetical protein